MAHMGVGRAVALPPVSRWLWGPVALMTSAWFVMMSRFGNEEVYTAMGPFSGFVLAAVASLHHRRLRPLLALKARPIIVGLAVGLVTTLATHAAFELARRVSPALEPSVQRLYQEANEAPLLVRLCWVVVIIGAEELLFRGLLLDALRASRHLGPAAAVAAVAVYALAQLGAGSGIVVAMAVVMGSIWTAQRVWTQSLLSPLIAHLVWTPTVIVLWPVL